MNNKQTGDIINTKKFLFEVYEIDSKIFKRINNKSYINNEFVSIQDLVYIKLVHYDYENNIRVGELIIHKAILNETKKIFKDLFKIKYQINSMKLIDDYWKNNPDESDRNSILNNNSSAFCYRNATNKKTLSNHALGISIDINPLDNPYIPRNKDHTFNYSGLTEYEKNTLIDRDNKAKENPHIITLNDEACKIFKKYGFECGGIWPKRSILNPCDWQHFQPNKKKMKIIKKRISKIHNKNKGEKNEK